MENSSTINYIPILLIFIIATRMAVAVIIISRLAGRNRPTKVKLEPYECGVEPIGNARERVSVKFYLVAMVFLLFDIETVFLIPWAVTFPNILKDPAYAYLRWIFYGEMMVFMALLLAGLIYVYRKGILDWTK